MKTPTIKSRKPKIKRSDQGKQLKFDFRVNTISDYLRRREEVFKKEGVLGN